MTSFMENITHKGIKAIADEVAKAYVGVLAAKKVSIDGEEKTEQELMNLYTKHFEVLMEPDVKKKKSGFLVFCEHQRPALQKDGLDFRACAVRLGELWNEADHDLWNQRASGSRMSKGSFIGKCCKFWYEAKSVDNDLWIRATVVKFNSTTNQHTLKYTHGTETTINININEWIDDEYFEWISKEDYDDDNLNEDEDEDEEEDEDEAEEDEDEDEAEDDEQEEQDDETKSPRDVVAMMKSLLAEEEELLDEDGC